MFAVSQGSPNQNLQLAKALQIKTYRRYDKKKEKKMSVVASDLWQASRRGTGLRPDFRFAGEAPDVQ